MRLKKKYRKQLQKLLLAGLLLLIILLFGESFKNMFGKDKEKPDSKTTHIGLFADFGIPLPEKYSVHGIDISKHQKDIDWKAVSEMEVKDKKISFVFIKACEGATRKDDCFEKNWEEARENNLIRGAYHFYRPAREPEEQADIFMSAVHLEKGDLPPVVDVEVTNHRSKKQIQHNLGVFLNLLEGKYGVKPIIYTNLSFYQTYLQDKFEKYPIWIACYFDESTLDVMNRKWVFWQHSENGHVNGIQGAVDFNVFKGSLDELKDLCIK